MRRVLATALELFGLAGLSLAFFLMWLPLGVAAAAVSVFLVGLAIGGGK